MNQMNSGLIEHTGHVQKLVDGQHVQQDEITQLKSEVCKLRSQLQATGAMQANLAHENNMNFQQTANSVMQTKSAMKARKRKDKGYVDLATRKGKK